MGGISSRIFGMFQFFRESLFNRSSQWLGFVKSFVFISFIRSRGRYDRVVHSIAAKIRSIPGAACLVILCAVNNQRLAAGWRRRYFAADHDSAARHKQAVDSRPQRELELCRRQQLAWKRWPRRTAIPATAAQATPA